MRGIPAAILGTALAATFGAFGCDDGLPVVPDDDLSNPFTDDLAEGKEDTAYQNPDGVEVEVDFEADVEAPAYRMFDAPADLGQFAVTYLRQREQFYLESIAEVATSDNRAEWLVDGEWITADRARAVPVEKLRRFRLRGLNAVLLHGLSNRVQVGQVFEAEVPIRPYAVMSEAGDACAEPDDHMGLSQSIYWYQWNPDRAGCAVDTQRATVTVTQTFQNTGARYPEYDRLVEDGRVTAVVLFGQIGDGAVTDSDPGVRNMKRMATWLLQARFEEVANPPVGRRFRKVVGGVELLYDLYSPYDFSGLSDHAHFANFQRAISEHEIVAYDGHSMLGASDFWSRPTYPDFYQIFLYGGCLGYEYYIQPILAGKGGWENVDIMSSVVEVSADANYYAAPFLARIAEAIENGYAVSWADMLTTIRRRVGDSTFGVCGVEDNCFTPTGSRCEVAPPPGDALRFESAPAVAIPDDDPAGVTSVIEVDQAVRAATVTLDLEVTHTWIGDLRIVVEHGGVEAVVWDGAGGSTQNIQQSFNLEAFAGADAGGTWTLRLVDGAARDTGTLNRWALVIQPQ
jgi:hypothetical protein